MDWKFLKAILLAMNFSVRWVNWIMECVSTIQYTLLINGNITQSFSPSKGLRQGNPLSLYLFLMCASILSLSLMKSESEKKIKGIKLGQNGCSFTHLFFADDSLLSLTNIQDILSWYYSILVQSTNLTKSDLYCFPNMPRKDQEALALSL